MTLFHGTPHKNKESILNKGLLVSGNRKDRDWCVYLTPNIETAKHYGELIFEIETQKSDKISSITKGEYLAWNNIHPDRLNIRE